MRIGLIGVGNMGEALLLGAKNSSYPMNEIGITSLHEAHYQNVAKVYGVQAFSSAYDCAKWAQLLFLCIKPQVFPEILSNIQSVAQDKAIVSIAAGIPVSIIQQALPQSRIVRIMPNTPVKAGYGALCMHTPNDFKEEEKAVLHEFLTGCGKIYEIEERLFDAVTALSGSGPAYVYVFLEALTEAGVLQGIPYRLAKDLAVQTVLGSAKLVQEGPEKEISQYKAEVLSPGGTTIYGISELEKGGLRYSVMDAVNAATKRAKELAKGK